MAAATRPDDIARAITWVAGMHRWWPDAMSDRTLIFKDNSEEKLRILNFFSQT